MIGTGAVHETARSVHIGGGRGRGFVSALREWGDKGVPILIQQPNSEISKIFMDVAAKLAGQLSVASEAAKKSQGLKIIST